MIGQTISHYKITEKIGGGGMGVVYKAVDTKLDRPVALKFLPPELTRDADAKRRFVHEAKAASALQHNNICTIHEIDETDDGHVFISMDCYEGHTLKELVAGGPLPVDEAADIVSQAAAGLSKAHEADVVHRDVKPANIIVTADGIVKIVDFGLAKLAGQSKVTRTGSTVGTVAYMSPEQARGEDVDARSDVFSLGCVMYELLTGKSPFSADHEAAVMYEIMNNDPVPIRMYRSDVPDELQRIVGKAMQKAPSQRYGDSSELLGELERFQTKEQTGRRDASGSWVSRKKGVWFTLAAILVLAAGYFGYSRYVSTGSTKSESERVLIAVLPFENLGPAEDEYFADGITEEITARLAKIHSLGVIARTSSIQYKNTTKDVAQIGNELDVAYILEGTIRWQRRSDGQSAVRVTPQLIRVSDGTHVWAELYQESLDDIFEVQSSVATRVVEALNVTLLDDERQDIETKPTTNLVAYQAYLRGVALNWAGGDILTAAAMFQKAVELDPSFALAHAALSRAHTRAYLYGLDATQERASLSKDAAARALELQPELPEAHVALGTYYLYCLWDFKRAQDAFVFTEKRRPNDTRVQRALSRLTSRQGDIQSALVHRKKALELDPRNADIVHEIGWLYTYLRQYADAIRYQDRAIAMAPDYVDPYMRKAQDFILWRGDLDSARSTLLEARRVLPSSQFFCLFVQSRLELLAENYEVVQEVLSSWPSETYTAQGYFIPKSLLKGVVFQLLEDSASARQAYDDARSLLEIEAAARPHDLAVRASLGIAYAGVGRREDALSEAKQIDKEWLAVRDPHITPRLFYQVAIINVMVGEYDAALDKLEYLLSLPGLCSVPLLRLDPRLIPLRDEPRFQKLLDKYSLEN